MSNLPYYLFTGESTSSVSAFKRNQAGFQSQNEQFKNAMRASREKAENDRKLKEKCVKIQAFWRSCYARRKLKSLLRHQFDREFEKCDDFGSITLQLRRLNYFWTAEDNDLQRIVRLVTLILSKNYLQSMEILESEGFTIAGFLISCIKYVAYAASDNKSSLTCLRCFEIYFKSNHVSNSNFKRLISRDYFRMLSQIVKYRIPDPMNDEIIEKPPVFLGESILDLYKLSLNIALRCNDKDLTGQCFRKLVDDLIQNWAPIYKCYILPQLCLNFTLDDFSSIVDDADEIDFYPDGPKSALYAYIWLFIIDKCQIRSNNTIRRIPCILQTFLVKYVDHLKSKISIGEDDDQMEFEEDDEPFRIRCPILDLCDGENLRRYFLITLAENDDPDFIKTLAMVYYAMNFLQKLKSDRTIKLTLVLPLEKSFLKRLWDLVSTCKVGSSFEPNRLFLETLHRGLTIKEADRKRCLPLLYVFCDLLRCRLCAADDIEIRMSNSAESVFPFNLNELKDISGSLRDVATGLVELALPDAKYTVPERYRAALQSMGADLTPDCPREWNELFQGVVQLLQLLQQLDERLEFCPPKYWAVKNCFALANRQFFRYSNRRRGYNMPFHAVRYFSRQEFEEGNKQLLSSSDLQALTILRKLPFLIPFEDRVVLIFENQLAELPLAKFFLDRLLTHDTGSVDTEVRHLESLDPILYKNLVTLKSPDIDVDNLNLDFSIMVNEFGETKTVMLKPHGNQIMVTKENKLEYIQLVTNFYLDKQIKEQVQSFCEGLASMIDLDWLRMFSPNELQMIISGDERTFDVDDLKNNTTVTITTDEADSDQVIRMFWNVIRSFNNELRRKLLKFVSGCSRPPLLGFKDLSPPFTIHVVKGEANRLPTAATCMNLLKLPNFKDEESLRSKLIYAIESASGFELS